MSGLPPGWARPRLGEIAGFEMGQAPPGSASNFAGNGTVFVKAGEFGPRRPIVREWTTDPKKLATAKDVLICVVGATAGKLNLGIDCAIGRSVAAIKPSSAIHQLLLYFQLLMRVDELRAGSTGSAQGVISRDMLDGLEVVLPPLSEQKRIADKLDAVLARVDASRERLGRVPQILRSFRQSVLAAATAGDLTREWREERGCSQQVQAFEFEDADVFHDYTFPVSWSTCRLSDIADIAGGVTKDSKKQSPEFVELPYLRVANVQRGYLDLSEVKTIRVPPGRVDELLLRKGDILFNEGGDIDKLGRGWIWSEELPKCVFQNHVFRGRLRAKDFEPRYFSWYSNSRGFDYFLARGKQTTNLASINKSVLSALPVAVPSVDEQKEIVRRVNELFQFADHLEHNCALAMNLVGNLTPSLLAKAFRGELVPQNSGDEPASELLAKVHHHRFESVAAPQRIRPERVKKNPVMKNTEKEAIRAAILKIKAGRFSFDELREQASADYESVKDALFELLQESKPVVRQVFDRRAKTMRLERVKS